MSESSETQAIKRDMEALRRDLRALADSVKQSSEARAQAGLDSARGAYGDLKREANRRTTEVGAEIESRPFSAVFAAFGIGLVLGKLIGR